MTITVRSKKTKKLWSQFFNLEVKFLSWLNINSNVITSLEEEGVLGYQALHDINGEVVDDFLKPPNSIRHICFLRNMDDEKYVKETIQVLREAYLIAVLASAKEDKASEEELLYLEENKRPPKRFPRFYSDVRQINISINEAYSSRNINKETAEGKQQVIKNYANYTNEEFELMIVQANKDIKRLHEFGLLSACIDNTLSDSHEAKYKESGLIKLMVDQTELLTLAHADSLQIRVPSGNQYKARIFFENGARERTNFGLMIINKHCNVHNVLPQLARPHSLKKVGNQFELPIKTKCSIWIK